MKVSSEGGYVDEGEELSVFDTLQDKGLVEVEPLADDLGGEGLVGSNVIIVDMLITVKNAIALGVSYG